MITAHDIATPAKYSRLTLYGILAVFLASVVLAFWSADKSIYQDERDYSELAESLLAQHALAYKDGTITAFRAPGYPFMLALVYSISDQPIAAKLLNSVALGLSVLVLVLIVRRVSASAERLAPILILGYPLLLYTSTLLYPQIIGCLLLGLLVLTLASEHLSLRTAAISGFIYGVLVFAIPAFVPLAPVFFVFLALRYRGAWNALIRTSAVFFLTAFLVVAPWTVRNYLVFDAFIPVSTNGGINLLMGNSAASEADTGMSGAVLAQCPSADQRRMNEVEYDRALGQCAAIWIKSQPLAAARLYLAKLANYFNYKNQLATAIDQASWKFGIEFITYYPMLIAAIVRLFLIRRFPLARVEVLIYLLYFGNAFLSAIFFTRLRFRIPFDYLLIAIEAIAVIHLMELFRNRSTLPHSGR
jgi:hypothetical protein